MNISLSLFLSLSPITIFIVIERKIEVNNSWSNDSAILLQSIYFGNSKFLISILSDANRLRCPGQRKNTEEENSKFNTRQNHTTTTNHIQLPDFRFVSFFPLLSYSKTSENLLDSKMNVNLVQMRAKVQGELQQSVIGSAKTKKMRKLSAKTRERRIIKKPTKMEKKLSKMVHIVCTYVNSVGYYSPYFCVPCDTWEHDWAEL